jgi:hypothetical protein
VPLILHLLAISVLELVVPPIHNATVDIAEVQDVTSKHLPLQHRNPQLLFQCHLPQLPHQLLPLPLLLLPLPLQSLAITPTIINLYQISVIQKTAVSQLGLY